MLGLYKGRCPKSYFIISMHGSLSASGLISLQFISCKYTATDLWPADI